MEVLKIETRRIGYTVDQIIENCRNLTVGDLMDILSQYDKDTPVITSHDDGYTYGPMKWGDFRLVETEDEEDA